MFKKKGLLIAFLSLSMLAVGLISCSQKAASLTVFAAASTTDIMQQLAQEYEKQKGISVRLNLASSGKLARQIESGAPADVFISASMRWMEYLKTKDLVQSDQVLLKNRLVLIVNKQMLSEDLQKQGISALSTYPGRVAMSDPEFVPAGMYAKDALQELGLYEGIQKQLLLGQSVRATLSVVELGEAALGIVYQTDALASDKVQVLADFPEQSYRPIVYPCGILKNEAGESTELAADFVRFISESDFALQLYPQKGFMLAYPPSKSVE